MKKFYTLLLSLCCGAMASAQTLTLTVDGEQVKNGSTITKVYTNDVKEKVPGILYGHGLYPEVFLSSSTDQNAQVVYTDPNKEGNLMVCFGGSCEALTAANNFTVRAPQNSGWYAMKAGKAEDLQIHYEAATNTVGTTSADPYQRSVNIEVKTQSGENFACTLILKYDPNASNVSVLAADKSDAAYYTLSGVRMAIPSAPGIYVHGGRKVVVK